MARKRRRKRGRKRESFRDRLFVNLSLKLFVGLVVIVTFLTISQCTVNKPEAPTWTTQFSVPLIDRTYDMPELIRRIDDPSLSTDSAGDPFFLIVENIDSLGVNADLTAPTTSVSTTQKFGAVSIQGQDIPPQTTPFASLASELGGVVPPASFDFVYDAPAVTNYSWITVSAGSLDCPIYNNMGVPLDTVQVQIFDLNTFQLIGSGSLSATLADGATDTVRIPLTGQTITNRLRMQVHGHTPGGVVLSTANKDLTVDMDLSNPFTIASGSVQIPAIDLSVTQTATLGSAHLVESATFQSGSLALNLVNASTLTADITVTIPDLKTNGVPVSITQTVPGNSTQPVSLDLAGYTVEPTDLTLPQDLSFQVDAHVDSSAPSYVTFNENDSLEATAQISNISFSSVRGIFNSVNTSFSPVAQTLSVPNGFDSAQFTAATLTLEIDNGSELDGSLSVTVQGNNGKQLVLSGPVTSGDPSVPVTSLIVENNLSDFLNPIPSSYTVGGSVSFGGAATRTVTQNDFVKARVRIESPLEVAFNGSTVQIDPESTDIDTTSIDVVTNHVVNAQVTADVTNHLPAGLQVLLVLSSDSATLYSAPELTVGPINVSAGQIDGAGRTIGSTISNNVISIDSADVQVLMTDTLYIGQLLTIENTGGLPVRFLGTDFVSVSAAMVVEYKFNGDF